MGSKSWHQFNHMSYMFAVVCAIGWFIFANIQSQLGLGISSVASSAVNILNNDIALGDAEAVNKSLAFMNEWPPSISMSVRAYQYTYYFTMLFAVNFILEWDYKFVITTVTTGLSIVNVVISVMLPVGSTSTIITCILKGFFEGMFFPFFIAFWSFWIPTMKNTTFITISLCGYFLGQTLSPVMFSSLMFSNIYYLRLPFCIIGAFGICWTLLWSFLEPRMKTCQLKRSYVANDAIDNKSTNLTSYHWKQMFTTGSTVSIFVVVLSSFLNMNAIALTKLSIPKLKDENDAVVAYTILLANLAMISVIMVNASISDRLRHNHSITKIRKFFICTGLFGSGILLPFMGIYQPKNLTIHLIILGLFIILQGTVLQSCFVNALDVVHDAAGFVLGISTALAGILITLTLFNAEIATALSGLQKSSDEFFNVRYLPESSNATFYAIIVVNILGCLMYACYGSAEMEKWAINNADNTNTNDSEIKDISMQPLQASTSKM